MQSRDRQSTARNFVEKVPNRSKPTKERPPMMRSFRPTLLNRTCRLRTYPPASKLSPVRPSVFAPRPATTRRFYSEQRQSESSSNSQQEGQQTKDSEDPKRHFKEDTSPPPDPNKSPLQVFVDTFKSELAKSTELQESVKALQDESGKIGDSEALRRAKEAYAKAIVLFLQEVVNIRNNLTAHQILPEK